MAKDAECQDPGRLWLALAIIPADALFAMYLPEIAVGQTQRASGHSYTGPSIDWQPEYKIMHNL